jgi:hypothetical protein
LEIGIKDSEQYIWTSKKKKFGTVLILLCITDTKLNNTELAVKDCALELKNNYKKLDDVKHHLAILEMMQQPHPFMRE